MEALARLAHAEPPPPGVPRWSRGFCTRRAGLSSPPPPGLRTPNRPHRACPGGAEASAQEGRGPPFSAPTGLVPVERGLVHQRGGSALPQRCCASSPSTGARPVGATEGASHPLVHKPTLHRGKPGGGGEGVPALLVHKPPLHRDKPGGGGEEGPALWCTSPRSTGTSPVGAVRHPGEAAQRSLGPDW